MDWNIANKSYLILVLFLTGLYFLTWLVVLIISCDRGQILRVWQCLLYWLHIVHDRMLHWCIKVEWNIDSAFDRTLMSTAGTLPYIGGQWPLLGARLSCTTPLSRPVCTLVFIFQWANILLCRNRYRFLLPVIKAIWLTIVLASVCIDWFMPIGSHHTD